MKTLLFSKPGFCKFEPVGDARAADMCIIFTALFLFFAINLNARQPFLPGINTQLKSEDSTLISISFSNETQRPVDVPVIPWLSRKTPYYFGGMNGRAANSTDYQPYN
jgi:hypothetical protein